MNAHIYALTDNYGNIRYIGKTTTSLKRRIQSHLQDVKQGKRNYRCNWIRSVLQKGLFPEIVLIGQVEGDGCKEEMAWISYGRQEGWALVNTTDGGEGMSGWIMPEETRKKISKGLTGQVYSIERRLKMSRDRSGSKNQNWGKPRSEATRAKTSKANTGKHPSEATRLKLSAWQYGRIPWNKGKKGGTSWNKGRHLSVKQRRQISEANSRRIISDKTKAKLTKANIERWKRLKNACRKTTRKEI